MLPSKNNIFANVGFDIAKLMVNFIIIVLY